MKPMTLPLKAARKQAELIGPLIRQLEIVVSRRQPADRVLQRYYREHPELGSRDRRFLSAMAFSWFRWRGWLTPLEGARLAMAYMLDAVESHPAVTLLAEQTGFSRFPPEADLPMAENLQPAGPLSVQEKAKLLGQWLGVPPPPLEQLVPAWLPERLSVPEGAESKAHGVRYIESFQTRPPTWLRTSPAEQQQVITALAQRSIPAYAHPQVVGAVRLQGSPDLRSFSREIPFEIQDLSSQCVGWVCRPARGERWWDTCAGAGGKTLHLADLMENQGSILATDIRAHSLDTLRARINRRHCGRIDCRVWDGIADPALGQYFDGVLVDAPCSGIGTWARNPDARWRTEENDIVERRCIQEQLLKAAAEKVRSGGRLVYSVCTVTEVETAALTAWFLNLHPDFELETFPHPLTGQPTNGLIRIQPWEANCNAMFIARMKRS
ncbi:MAG: RsmB/NOP family class I SAM-dependent RNA methyltransferase [Lentisphaerae bacterium]|nr:RsmB/NOP family class I SAM-dependent RNA methyltransferase [Lentisphaerota bacterium]